MTSARTRQAGTRCLRDTHDTSRFARSEGEAAAAATAGVTVAAATAEGLAGATVEEKAALEAKGVVELAMAVGKVAAVEAGMAAELEKVTEEALAAGPRVGSAAETAGAAEALVTCRAYRGHRSRGSCSCMNSVRRN